MSANIEEGRRQKEQRGIAVDKGEPNSSARKKTWPRFYDSLRRTAHLFCVSRLLKQVLGLTHLVLGGALRLVRASFSLLFFVASYGSGSLFGLALRLVQCPFTLVLGAALSAHVLLLPSSLVTCNSILSHLQPGLKCRPVARSRTSQQA